jgi:hypothetical protein
MLELFVERLTVVQWDNLVVVLLRQINDSIFVKCQLIERESKAMNK